MKLLYMMNLAKIRFKRWRSHFGQTLLLRNRQTLRQSLNLIARIKIKNEMQQAGLVLTEFFSKTYFIDEFVKKAKNLMVH
jgi:hypothetical protein